MLLNNDGIEDSDNNSKGSFESSRCNITATGPYLNSSDLGTLISDQLDDLVAVLDHRLRTPLIAARRACALLLEGDLGQLTSDQFQLVKLVQDNNVEVDRLVMMLSDICKYRNKQKILDPRPVACGAVICKPINSLQAMAADLSVKLDIALACENEEIVCDAKEVAVVIQHLVDNAIKHARSTVSVRALIENGSIFRLDISDDGPGIPEADLGHLFNRFFMMSASGRYAPSTGIGLCLCSQICSAHGGSIEYQHEPEAGTRFIVRLPRGQAKAT